MGISCYHSCVLLVLFSFGFFLRFFLLNNTALSETLEDRVEISTPLTSWKRAVEGVSLSKAGISPYDGDAFHESPFALEWYTKVLSQSSQVILLIFSVCDILTAFMLGVSARFYLSDLVIKENKLSKLKNNAAFLLLDAKHLHLIPYYVACVYLFSPYSIASCCGKSTVIFQNMLISLFILLMTAGWWFGAAIILGVISYHSFYYISFIVPFVMYLNQICDENKSKISNTSRLLLCVLVCCSTIGLLVHLSHEWTGSWDFLTASYGCMLFVPDLKPNIGLFWYFFTEMFEHFRMFFLWTFQLNIFVYTVPLGIRLRQEPMLLLFIQLMLITIFKPYPCIGDVALYLSLFPVWSHLFQFMRQGFIFGCVLLSCTFLAPTLWHLWIYSGSANANFYFAITLVMNTGQISILTDILTAYIKREYYLFNGIKTDDDGTLKLLRLQ